MTVISPGFTDTNFVGHVRNEALQAQMKEAAGKNAMDPRSVAKAIVYAIEEPSEINVGEILVRSTAQP